jgi:hypothetical protein
MLIHQLELLHFELLSSFSVSGVKLIPPPHLAQAIDKLPSANRKSSFSRSMDGPLMPKLSKMNI